MFGEEDGIKALAATLCVYMLYVARYMSSVKFDISRIEGSALGNRIAVILGVAVLVVLLWGLYVLSVLPNTALKPIRLCDVYFVLYSVKVNTTTSVGLV